MNKNNHLFHNLEKIEFAEKSQLRNLKFYNLKLFPNNVFLQILLANESKNKKDLVF